VNPLDGTNYLETVSAFMIVRVKSESLRLMILVCLFISKALLVLVRHRVSEIHSNFV